MDFKAFPKIERLSNSGLSITQKIHGTNAQVHVFQKEDGTLDLLVGSRTRWITPENDNYNFAAHVYSNKEAFLELGVGTHFGEWAGPGINSGEGLKERVFVLFDYWKYNDRPSLPPKTVTVPVFYRGKFDLSEVDKAMNELRAHGSKLVPGFARPEGVVVQIKDVRYKVLFDAEETKWKDKDPTYKPVPVEGMDVSHLLQPIRLEKLLSRDETYIREYPKSLSNICSNYVTDLIEENQINGTKEEVLRIKKALCSSLFKFVKSFVEENRLIS